MRDIGVLGLAAILALLSMACDCTQRGPRREPAERTVQARELVERSVLVDGARRSYHLHLPKGWDGKTALPLLMMLHGGGGTGTIAMEETAWADKADRESFLAVFPTATPPDPRRRPRFSTNPPVWNDGSGRYHAGERDIADVAYLSAVLDDVLAAHPVDERRIYVTGFSNGASMTFRFGLERSSRLAAIAPVAGAFWARGDKLEHPLPMLYLTGTADPMNPLDGGVPRFAKTGREHGGRAKPPVAASVRRWSDLLGCPTEPTIRRAAGVERRTFAPCRGGAEIELVLVEGTGHVWPGGRTKLPEWMVGADSGKLDATAEIWRFFAKHSRPPARDAR